MIDLEKRVMSLMRDKLSPETLAEIEALGEGAPGFAGIDPERLSDKAKREIKGLILSALKEESGYEFVPPRMVEDLNNLASLMEQGIDRYITLSDELLLPFHVESLRGQMIKMYNACAHFVSLYNAADLEHHDCIEKGKARRKDAG